MAWERIRGHDDVRRRFEGAAGRGRLGHAYLFAGPPGVGKRLFAGELAKALLCESPAGPLAACDRCPSCTLVAAGTHPDFVVARKPDDKLELPIDTIRELCGTLGLKPARGRRKIAVVEDADVFNEESANGFLKTLEEPPPGSLLILLATSAETQLSTIRSRCQLVQFRPLPPDDLRAVLAEQGVSDPAKIERLARLAAGSPGRAVALNDDELWAFRGTVLDALAAARPSGQPLAVRWTGFVEAAGKESAAQRQRASLAVGLVADMLSAALRLSLGVEPPGLDPGEADRLRRLADRLGSDALADLLERCVEADYHIDRRVQLAVAIELLVDRLTRPAAA
jgi:DNA polymerase-3 subunit delta'